MGGFISFQGLNRVRKYGGQYGSRTGSTHSNTAQLRRNLKEEVARVSRQHGGQYVS